MEEKNDKEGDSDSDEEEESQREPEKMEPIYCIHEVKIKYLLNHDPTLTAESTEEGK